MKKEVKYVAIYLIMIVFITLLVRQANLMRSITINPFWSYKAAFNGYTRQINQILLNIALFVPFGYLLRNLDKKCGTCILISLFISFAIELIQYFSCRGKFDIDDIFNNTLGAFIGCLIWKLLYSKSRLFSYIMLLLGTIGCIISFGESTKSIIDYTNQYSFSFSYCRAVGNRIELSGKCSVYNGETPEFFFIIDGKSYYPNVKDNIFELDTSLQTGKHQVFIQFKGYNMMPTGTFLRIADDAVRIEYVSGDVIEPEGLPVRAILKAYNSEYDTYIYQDGDRLLWLIGCDAHDGIGVFYHIQTNEPDKLPEKRQQYGFDNLDFKIQAETMPNELNPIGHYRVFEKPIPTDYNVTAIDTGFSNNGEVKWRQTFRVEPFE